MNKITCKTLLFAVPVVLGMGISMASTPASAGGLIPELGGLMDSIGGDSNGAANTPAKSASVKAASTLSSNDIIAGLKDALKVGSERVVAQLGRKDGFNADPAIHIPLPESMQPVKSALDAAGMGSLMDDLELKMNRAAEQATPKAEALFVDAIRQMSISDAKGILNGPNDAATQYFKNKMSAPLAKEMKPIVDTALKQAGAVQAYDAVMSKYESMPLVPDVKANLDRFVLDRGMQGIFHYMAVQEASIRKNPASRTTEILQKVFGGK